MNNRAEAHPNFGARFVMLLSATGTVLLVLFGLRLSESLTDRIHEARVQVAHDFRYLQQQSHTLSRMLVQSSPVQRGAHFKHIGLLDNYLTPSARELNIDLIMVHDVQGDLLYQNRESTTNLPVLAPEILRKALDGQSFSRIERSQTGFQLVSTSPIRHATDDTRITGALTLGYHLDDAFFEDLREMTGTEVLLSHSQGVIASSFEGLAPSKILAEPHLLDIASTRYDLSPIPLKQAHDSTLKMVVAVDNEQVRSTLYWVMLVIPLLFVLFWRERTITEQHRAKTMEGAVAEVQAQISDAEQAASVSKRARVTAQEELESTQHLLMRAQRLSITGEQLSSVSADIHSSIESILQVQKEQRSQTTLGLQIMSRLGLGGDDARNLEGALRDLENGIYENQLVGRRIWELVTAIMSQNTTVR
ncbi:MAG: CHASE4 domain-containing protein, partial [Myxococcota bacterium]|nr:CHASE4 domain-containing protein [Myxococcota bacterium]